MLFFATQSHFRGRPHEGEVPALLLIVCLGTMGLAASLDLALIALFIQLVTVGSYILVGIAKGNRSATKAAFKMFLFSATVGVVMIYRMVLLFGLTWTMRLSELAMKLPAMPDLTTIAALLLVLACYGFEVTLGGDHDGHGGYHHDSWESLCPAPEQRETPSGLLLGSAGRLYPRRHRGGRAQFPGGTRRAALSRGLSLHEPGGFPSRCGFRSADSRPPASRDYDQVDALCHQIQPGLQRAVAALNDPNFVSNVAMSLVLGPRVEAEGVPCPVAHLQGMVAAAREIREWAAGLIAQYELAVKHVDSPLPAGVSTHITALQSQLAQADSQLRFGVDLVGQISQSEATPQLHEEAEDSLWAAMQSFFLLNQAVAMPEVLQASRTRAPGVGTGATPRTYRDRRIRPDDLWRVAAPSARSDIRSTKFGTDEMVEMCGKMGGILSAGAQRYLDEVDTAVARGDTYIIAAMANCPFEPLYRARRPLNLAGAQIPASYEFHWNFHRGISNPRSGLAV